MALLFLFGLLSSLCLGAAIEQSVDRTGPADTYLSDEFFPGLHICQWIDGGRRLEIFARGQRPQLGSQPVILEANWTTLADMRLILELVLKIPELEPLQTPWALFDSQGNGLDELDTVREAPVFFLLELGRWMWPAVRVGFEHQVHGVFPDRPAILRTMSLRPVIFEVRDFISHEETEEIMEFGRSQGLVQSTGVMTTENIKKGTKNAEFRTSSQTWLYKGKSEVADKLDLRVSQLTRVPPDHNEAAQLLRYDGGEYYHAHLDWIELEMYEGQRHIWERHHMGWQERIGNVFWFLNDVEEGGETIFPKHGQVICEPESKGGFGIRTCDAAEDPMMESCEADFKMRPRRGSVIMWYNLHPNGRGDRNSLHAGCPPGRNMTKWAANKWFDIKPHSSTPMWVDGHPALERHGFYRSAPPQVPDPNACKISFSNEAKEAVDVEWVGDQGYQKIMKVDPGKQSVVDSYLGHQFRLVSEVRSSNVITCSETGRKFVLEESFVLRARRPSETEL